MAGGSPNQIQVEVGKQKNSKKQLQNLENGKYKLLNKKLQQVLIETVKFIASNIARFKKSFQLIIDKFLMISKPLMNFLTTIPSAFQTLKIIQ